MLGSGIWFQSLRFIGYVATHVCHREEPKATCRSNLILIIYEIVAAVSLPSNDIATQSIRDRYVWSMGSAIRLRNDGEDQAADVTRIHGC